MTVEVLADPDRPASADRGVLWQVDLTNSDLRDMGEDCVPLLARRCRVPPVYPREGSASYHAHFCTRQYDELRFGAAERRSPTGSLR